ncbi:MAG: putative glycolipid-binding domain-containing protein [Actinomycetota bacterium]
MQSSRSWIGVDDPSRVDRATLTFGADSLRGHGTSTTPEYALAWRLEVGDRWVTRLLEVAVQAEGWSRSLLLERSAGGEWRAESHARGVVDLSAPGLADPSWVRGAIDCDLGLCPVTNTMPIRRLGLLRGSVPETSIVAAWVEVPSLRVLREEQLYAALGDGEVRYASADRRFTARLSVDDGGIVRDYEGLARIVEDPA